MERTFLINQSKEKSFFKKLKVLFTEVSYLKTLILMRWPMLKQRKRRVHFSWQEKMKEWVNTFDGD